MRVWSDLCFGSRKDVVDCRRLRNTQHQSQYCIPHHIILLNHEKNLSPLLGNTLFDLLPQC